MGAPESQTIGGGGIAGITAALEAAEKGHDTVLPEKSPSRGGRVARMHLYFPKLCPPHGVGDGGVFRGNHALALIITG